jgi:regulator of sigma E protease
VFFLYGEPVPTEQAKVGSVEAGMPAAEAGLRSGDVVIAIDGKPVETWLAMAEAIRASQGREVELTVRREGRTISVAVTPKSSPVKNIFGEEVDTAYRIGIAQGFERQPVGLLTAVRLAGQQTVMVVETLAISVFKILQGKISAREIGGPILIVQAAGQQAEVGLEPLIRFMAFISINLGILNLLPIPILDGGHLLFFSIEAVMRRPLDTRHRMIAQQIGLAILVFLMFFAFYNDITRNIPGWG